MNDQLNVFRQVLGHFVDDVAFEQHGQRAAMGRADHQNINAQRGRYIQDGRRRVFAETLRAEVFLDLCFVVPRSQIHADMRPRHFAHTSKNPLSSGAQSFLTGCEKQP